MRDALKNYLALASGVTDVGRQRALAASKALVAQGEATAEQVTSLAEDLLESSKQNRTLVTSLVRSEIEKAMNRLGLATADEVQRLTRRLQSVESALRDASGSDRTTTGVRSATVTSAAAKPATARPVAAKPAVKPVAAKTAVKAATKKPAATKAAAKKPAAGKAPTAKARATKAPAKKATTKPAARKSAAKPAAKKATRTSARKATP